MVVKSKEGIRMLTFQHYNKRWLLIFNIIVYSHFAEHIAQMIQLYLLHWDRKQSLGLLGLWQPQLVHSEWLHYAHALFMVIGLAMMCKINKWLFLAFFLGFLHHIEHFCLLYQAITHHNWWDQPKPVTYLQMIWLPRIELHFIYNLIVLIPMIIGLWYYKRLKINHSFKNS